ncbi:MAG: carboxymuconolactone decarboxylase family protein [Sphingomonadales bacterium]
MVFFPSLAKKPVLISIFEKFPGPVKPLLEYHDIVLRGPSTLSVAERELIAAYVSALNGCRYCRGVHTVTAEVHGVPKGLIDDLYEDIETAAVDEKFMPVLRYVKKLTEAPDSLTQADADAIFDAGWDEQTLHDAVAVCCLFNFMNRFVEGLGVEGDQTYFELSGKRVKDSYTGLLKVLGLE